ncbi:peptidase M15 [Marinobacterium aestuarii]|uniref:D-alanyl-D-alanine dipeptidase n=1 Tax=Marinobacterium aestuarii TaxID=1821621 RepID=A0A1A9EUH7_9GAMM|nr:M15 family metallopeptidase [Marinobacterium aestuarii]ANG61193.1 peptidase M15 [Marinobacterium aestuarii]
MSPAQPFVDLTDQLPGIVLDLKYCSSDNFMGTPVDGYEAPKAWLTEPAALALVGVQRTLARFDLGLKIFDAYRPQRAVDHFLRWCDSPCEAALKARYYPSLEKAELFSEGYLSKSSSHSRGSTVDLTIVSLNNSDDRSAELDMGTIFDFFGPESWLDYDRLPLQARANRLLLQQLMVDAGFIPFHHEWWHFTLRDEPYPHTAFDIPIR